MKKLTKKEEINKFIKFTGVTEDEMNMTDEEIAKHNFSPYNTLKILPEDKKNESRSKKS